MTSSLIAALDAALAQAGEDTILRRIVGTAPNTINIDVVVRASVRSFQPVELVGGISQTDSHVIISPTQIANAQWPGGELPSPTVANPTLPRINDRLIINGRVRSIQVVDPIYIGGELVRIEMRVQ
jgi:hypothetical protein